MSSVSIAEGKLFTLGNRGGAEHLIALNLEDGKEIWATAVGKGGDPNSTPTYATGKVYGIGRGGDLCCVDASTGEKIWSKSFGSRLWWKNDVTVGIL